MGAINRYQSKINKPFLERFHIIINTDAEFSMKYNKNKYDLDDISKKIKRAWSIQNKRYKDKSYSYNAFVSGTNLIALLNQDKKLIEKIKELSKHYKLTLRKEHNMIRLARSIADFEGHKDIREADLYEALSYQIF